MNSFDINYNGVLVVIFRDGVIQYHNISSTMSSFDMSHLRILESDCVTVSANLINSEENILAKFSLSLKVHPQPTTTVVPFRKYPSLSKVSLKYHHKQKLSRNFFTSSHQLSFKKYQRSVQNSLTTRNPLKIFYPDPEIDFQDTIVNIRSNAAACDQIPEFEFISSFLFLLLVYFK